MDNNELVGLLNDDAPLFNENNLRVVLDMTDPEVPDEDVDEAVSVEGCWSDLIVGMLMEEPRLREERSGGGLFAEGKRVGPRGRGE